MNSVFLSFLHFFRGWGPPSGPFLQSSGGTLKKFMKTFMKANERALHFINFLTFILPSRGPPAYCKPTLTFNPVIRAFSLEKSPR